MNIVYGRKIKNRKTKIKKKQKKLLKIFVFSFTTFIGISELRDALLTS